MTKLIVAFHNFANSPKTAVRNCSRQDIAMCFTQLRTAVVEEFAWLREAPVSFIMTVFNCPSICIRASPTEWIYLKFDWGDFVKIGREYLNLVKSDKISATLRRALNVIGGVERVLSATKGELIVAFPWQRFQYLLHY